MARNVDDEHPVATRKRQKRGGRGRLHAWRRANLFQKGVCERSHAFLTQPNTDEIDKEVVQALLSEPGIDAKQVMKAAHEQQRRGHQNQGDGDLSGNEDLLKRKSSAIERRVPCARVCSAHRIRARCIEGCREPETRARRNRDSSDERDRAPVKTGVPVQTEVEPDPFHLHADNLNYRP